MLESTMLLISDDPALIESAWTVGQSVENLKFAVLPRIDAAYAYDAWSDVALVLIHQARPGPATEIGRLLRMLAASRRPVATLVLGPRQDADYSTNLLRLGVADYLEAPVDVSRLAYLVDILTIRSRTVDLRQDVLSGPTDGTEGGPPAEPIFEDETPEILRIIGQVRRAAPHDTTILLSGELGTGKSRLARLIHDLSPRRDEPFLVVNCEGLTASTIEADMFGHVRGAFPGADSDRQGKFAEVGRGTLFLDGVDSLPLALQAKLLRVLDDKSFEPVGSNHSQTLRARVMASSSRSLKKEVAANRFRSDLFYRLNVVAFDLPPLRDRRSSIPALVSRFLADAAAEAEREVVGVSEPALRVLEEYDWPGNIQELRNVLQRVFTLTDRREISVDDLPKALVENNPWPNRSIASDMEEASARSARATLAQIKGEAELARITEALEKHGNNRLRAAGELGISRMTLYKKLYKYGLMQHQGLSRGGVA